MTHPIFYGLGTALRVLAALLRRPDPVDVARERREAMRERAERARYWTMVERGEGLTAATRKTLGIDSIE
jgi:hypothetical protein